MSVQKKEKAMWEMLDRFFLRVLRGITGHQQIFAEGMGRLLEKIGHSKIPLSHRSFIVLLIINIIFNNIANVRYGQAAMT